MTACVTYSGNETCTLGQVNTYFEPQYEQRNVALEMFGMAFIVLLALAALVGAFHLIATVYETNDLVKASAKSRRRQ